MGKLSAFFAVLRYGSSLSDPAVWKHRQNRLNALIGLLGAVALLLPLLGIKVELSNEEVVQIAGGIATLVGLFINPYLTTATTDKIGLPSKHPPVDEPGDQGSGSDDFQHST